MCIRDRSMHSWFDPFDRVVTLGKAHGIPVVTPVMGEAVSTHATTDSQRWWEGSRVKETEQAQVKEQLAAEQL
jgi:hypothetical protein